MFIIKCPKCQNKSLTVDLENTFKLYHECFEAKELILPESIAPEVTKNIIITCSEYNCNYTKKVHYSEFMEQVINEWATVSWKVFLNEFGKNFSYENYFTRYLVNKDLKSIVSQKDIDNNPIIKELINYVEKKSNK